MLASSFPTALEVCSHPPVIHHCKITRVQKRVTITALFRLLTVIYKLYSRKFSVPKGRDCLQQLACAANLTFLLLQGTQDNSLCSSDLVIEQLMVLDAKQTSAEDYTD